MSTEGVHQEPAWKVCRSYFKLILYDSQAWAYPTLQIKKEFSPFNFLHKRSFLRHQPVFSSDPLCLTQHQRSTIQPIISRPARCSNVFLLTTAGFKISPTCYLLHTNKRPIQNSSKRLPCEIALLAVFADQAYESGLGYQNLTSIVQLTNNFLGNA